MKRKKYTIEEVRKIAEEKGGKCLDKEYKNNSTPMVWKCNVCNYIWKTSFKNINIKGSWCRKCSTKNRKKVKNKTIRKITMNIVNELAKTRGGKCIEKEYKHSKIPMKWQCGECDNIWEATFTNVDCGSWCPKCSIKSFCKTIEDAHELAKKRGGKCLEEKYINHKTNMRWQCGKCNHIWKACFNNVKIGTWCPKCNSSRGERKICSILEKMNINYELEKRLQTEKKMRFDFFIPSKNIAIEYDGVQHFKIGNRYTPNLETLKHRQEMDIYKTQYSIDNNIKLVRIHHLSFDYIESILYEVLNNDFTIAFSEYNPYKYIIKTITGIGG